MVCFDGDPNHPSPDALWRLVADEAVTYFGTSAGHLMASRAAGLEPRASLDLSQLRGVGSTGSPLPEQGFTWVYEKVSPTVRLTSVSGGTDICSAFVGGSPLCDVRAGEISAPTLGADVAALDADGNRLTDAFGELSVFGPMPSMPVALWGDDDKGTRLWDTYFSQRDGVWSHGDWALFHSDMSCMIAGRSDATLNRGGVRLGTSEFYSVVDDVTGVEDCVVVHLDGDDAGQLILLVATGEHQTTPLDAGSLRALIKTELSPRHVPDHVIEVRHLPRTLTGKRLEKPIKQILLGSPPDSVVSRGSVTWPEALDDIAALGTELAKEN
jgi:acetoacetyl-CoA synthetase